MEVFEAIRTMQAVREYQIDRYQKTYCAGCWRPVA